MKIDKARLPELELIYLELKMKVLLYVRKKQGKERNNVEKLLVPFKSTWKEKGVTIVSDGWRDPTGKFLINSIATSRSVPIFFKVVNCFGEVKDRFFISDLMQEVINESEAYQKKCLEAMVISGKWSTYREDDVGKATFFKVMFTMDPKKWWANVGAQTPFLQTLAFKLLGQPSASSCA
uniref:DUF659 domain-containing protein n=2 Tax=Brassica TaxID=3705 RepID=A0A3P6D0Z4_BRAOL|nr:unnamed protein product [Brassica oleracea]